MNCNDAVPDLKNLSKDSTIYVLKVERNKFAKSRQQWIQAAFDLNRGDNTLFEKLKREELCNSCIEKYSIKTELQ